MSDAGINTGCIQILHWDFFHSLEGLGFPLRNRLLFLGNKFRPVRSEIRLLLDFYLCPMIPPIIDQKDRGSFLLYAIHYDTAHPITGAYLGEE